MLPTKARGLRNPRRSGMPASDRSRIGSGRALAEIRLPSPVSSLTGLAEHWASLVRWSRMRRSALDFCRRHAIDVFAATLDYPGRDVPAALC